MFSVCSTSVIVNFTLFKLARDDFTHPQRSYWRNGYHFHYSILFYCSFGLTGHELCCFTG